MPVDHDLYADNVQQGKTVLGYGRTKL